MRSSWSPVALILIAFVCVTAMSPVTHAAAATVEILVIKEHGVGSPTLVQPYLDRFIAIAAEENGWAEARGEYYNNRTAAEAFIQAHNPRYGIFSLPAFLALQAKHKLAVVGHVVVSLAGGRQYSIISKTVTDLAGCKGKSLVSDHVDDARFIERIVSGGAFKLSEFSLLQTQRPLQTIKKLIGNEAVCALIDEAQLAELPHLDGAAGIHTVWKSAELPQMLVAAFPSAPAAERKTFQEHLDELCDGDRQSICAEVGIVSLKAANPADYAAIIAAYGN